MSFWRVIIAVIFFATSSFDLLAQNSVWNNQSFKFTRDTTSLVDMSGATLVSFENKHSQLLNFPDQFLFRYGLDEFRNFSVSVYGYLKLGTSETRGIFADEEDSVIAPFFCPFDQFEESKYKVIGSSPRRKFVVQWEGFNILDNGRFKTQLILNEQNGRIEILYSGLSRFSGFDFYMVFCNSRILGNKTSAWLKINLPNPNPTVNYNRAFGRNFDTIANKTRFTFQPDTIKPAAPTVQIANVQSACYEVNVIDNSTNESIIGLVSQHNNRPAIDSKIFSTSINTTGTVYKQSETAHQPASNHVHKAFTSNGFLNSDTVSASVRTLMPLISGLKRIPGDYPTIKALLDDASCKHIGPNLIIELQANYNYSAEPQNVKFQKVLNNLFLNSIVVRPAPGVSLTLSSNRNAPIFDIDSVRGVIIDGRAGGVGNVNNLTITQKNNIFPAIRAFDKSDNGAIKYCNIDGLCTNGDVASIYLYGPDNFEVSYCKVGPPAGFSNRAIKVAGFSGPPSNVNIRNNEFFRFFTEAIYASALVNSSISNNRFYQPEIVPAYDPKGLQSANSVIYCINRMENLRIDSNLIGGSSVNWGEGKWIQAINQDFSIINSSNNGYIDLKNYIRRNKIANLKFSGANRLSCIYSAMGALDISSNEIGSTDSLASIEYDRNHFVVYLDQSGPKIIKDNIFSGIKTEGFLDVLIVAISRDSVIAEGNDFGGVDHFSMEGGEGVLGISVDARSNNIRNNKIRGLFSKRGKVRGIKTFDAVTAYSFERNSNLDRNKIYHLGGIGQVIGIESISITDGVNSVRDNEIFDLELGQYENVNGGNATGINVSHYPYSNNIADDSLRTLFVSGNYIHHFGLIDTTTNLSVGYSGIVAHGQRVKLHNNMIGLGMDRFGRELVGHAASLSGIYGGATLRLEIEHNSVFLTGKPTASFYGFNGIEYGTPKDLAFPKKKKLFVTNNIVQIDGEVDLRHYSQERGSFNSYPNDSVFNTVSDNNIWFSNTDTGIVRSLSYWKSLCKCDGSTIIADPKFINSGSNINSFNMHIQAGSPADKSVIPSIGSIDVDIDTQKRSENSPSDVGADAITPCATGNFSISLSQTRELIELCTGSSLSLNASIVGSGNYTLQWQKDLVNIPGATTSSYTITSEGTYRLVLINSCGVISSKTVQVLFNIGKPDLYLEEVYNEFNRCDSGSLILKGSYRVNTISGNVQVKWYKNNILLPNRTSLLETFTGIRTGDRYRLQIVNVMPCGTYVSEDSVVLSYLRESRIANIQILKYDTVWCEGLGKIKIQYKLTGPHYSGQKPTVGYVDPNEFQPYSYVGDSLIVFDSIKTTRLFLHVPSHAGSCNFGDTSTILDVINLKSVNAPSITQNGNSLVSSAATKNQWYRSPDILIAGANQQTYSPKENGTYFVRIVSNGCLSEKSNAINFVTTGIIHLPTSEGDVSIFPNPISGNQSLNLYSKKLSGTVTVDMIDFLGKKVATSTLVLYPNQTKQIIIPQTLMKGIYFLVIRGKKDSFSFKLILQ